MKEKTFNNLMKKTKKELIEIIFRKDDVHTGLNEKIASLEKDLAKEIELREIATKDMNDLSEEHARLIDENKHLNKSVKEYSDKFEHLSNAYKELTNEHADLTTNHFELNKVHNDLIKYIKKYKNKIVILTIVSMIELIAILAFIIM